MPLHKVAGYEVARLSGRVTLTPDGEVFDELKVGPPNTDKSGPSLFLVPKGYKL